MLRIVTGKEMISMADKKLRIEIKDLPKDMKVSREEMRKIMGGIGTWPTPEKPVYYPIYRYPRWLPEGESGGGCGCGCG
jgi:hypothetical protein